MVYVVEAGDTGEKIAEKFTGSKNRWPELLTVNPTLRDPTYGIRLYAGKTINLPPAWSAPAPAPAPIVAPSDEKKGLSTGAMVGLAAAGAVVVGGAVYAVSRRKGGKSRRRSRRK